MDILRKCNVKDQPASQHMSCHSSRRLGHADKTTSSHIEPNEARVNRLTFTEDFTLEHSRPGLHIAFTGIPGSF